MHSSTKERFELISDIINILGEKGREVRIDYVSDLLQNKFANKFKNAEFNLQMQQNSD